MERTLEIDNKKINFKSTAATPLRYKAQFGRDFFADLMKLGKLEDIKGKSKKVDYDKLSGIDFDVFYNIVWILAKTADKTIPEPIEWLDEFEEFPIFEIIPQLQDFILNSINTKKK